jgi:4-hydroxymandelate oxidase
MVGDMSEGGVLPPLSAIPSDIESLADYEQHAIAHIPEASWRHIQSGCGRDVTLAANRDALDRIRLLPRMLADVREGSTQIDLFGRSHASPILLAPIAYQRLAHEAGELATVRAATALGVTMILSTLSSIRLEEVAAAASSGAQELGRQQLPLWFQLYFQEDRDQSLRLVRRAEDAGYQAIVVTVDASMKRVGFALPPGVEAANLRGLATARQEAVPGEQILFGTPLVDRAPRWEDIEWLRAQTYLPIIIKGLLVPDDGRIAVEHGVDGIVVSNHGGRVMDGVPSALDMLPDFARVVGPAVPLLVDGGVRSGTDVLKALALGARAVLVGRPQMHALAVAGMIGVAHMLHMLRAELELGMAQLGCRTPGDVTSDRILR